MAGLSLKEILVENSTYQSNKLRIRLLKSGLKKHICEGCYNFEWRGKPIPLELEHINGDNSDNRLENLKLLCPNCHAQTDSYRGKNWGKSKNKHFYAPMVKLENTFDLKSNALGFPVQVRVGAPNMFDE